MKKLALIAAAGSLAAITAPAHAADMAPAYAAYAVPAYTSILANADYAKDPPPWAPAHGRRAKDRYGDRYDRYDRDDRYEDRTYDRYGRYYEPRQIRRGDRVWQGNDGRYYCQRSNGTTGLIIGAAGGALLGREVDRRGDRTLGTVIGGAIGALLGREIERGRARCQ